MSMLYRKRLKNETSVRTTVALRPETMKGLDRIRELFHRRWPLAAYPTLSYVLEQVLSKEISLFDGNQIEMNKAVAEFERKYPAGTKPYNAEHYSTGEKAQVNQ